MGGWFVISALDPLYSHQNQLQNCILPLQERPHPSNLS